MPRLEPRIERLEQRLSKPEPQTVVMLFAGKPDFEQRRQEAVDAGHQVITIVGVRPKRAEESVLMSEPGGTLAGHSGTQTEESVEQARVVNPLI